MAVTYRTVTGSVADLLGGVAANPRAWLETNLPPGQAVLDTDGNRVLLGAASVSLLGGSFSISVIDHASSDVNPTGIQYRLSVEYTDTTDRKRKTWTSGWLAVTADGDIADMVAEQYLPPTYASEFITEIQGYVDQAQAYAESGNPGETGPAGRGVVSIVRTAGDGTPGTVDTYTITYTDATTTTFEVTNGDDGLDGADGRGITSIARTSGTGAAGTTDTYTITYTDATTSAFQVVNGANGTNGTNGTNGQGVPTGGTTGQVLKKNSATNYDTSWADPSGGSGAGVTLARVVHNPTTLTTYTPTETNADMDATNLAITLTALTTSAEIEAEATCVTASPGLYFSLRQGTTNVAGTACLMGVSGQSRATATMRVTGLTVGVSYTFKLAFRAGTGGGSSVKAGGPPANEFTGSTAATYAGPIVITATAA